MWRFNNIQKRSPFNKNNLIMQSWRINNYQNKYNYYKNLYKNNNKWY